MDINAKNKVIHYKLGKFLSLTENWIYTNSINVSNYVPYIYCHGIDKIIDYNFTNIRILDLSKGNSNPFILFNKVWKKLFKYYPYFAWGMINDKPGLIHAHYGPSGYEFLKLKSIFNLPMITTFYGFDLSQLIKENEEWKERYRILFESGDHFLVEGSHMKEGLISLGCDMDKITVHHLGVNLDKIPYRKRIRSENEEVKILVSATFREKKGIPNAVEALGKLLLRMPKIKIKMTIVGESTGKNKEEEEKKKILSKIKQYKLHRQIELLGFKPYDDLIEMFYDHHIFMAPSITARDGDNEGGAPVSIIEASASGMPIVSSKHCDIPEVVLENQSGYLAEENNVDMLSEKLQELVQDDNRWSEIGLAGRKHIEKFYDAEKQIKKLEVIYDSFYKRTVK